MDRAEVMKGTTSTLEARLALLVERAEKTERERDALKAALESTRGELSSVRDQAVSNNRQLISETTETKERETRIQAALAKAYENIVTMQNDAKRLRDRAAYQHQQIADANRQLWNAKSTISSLNHNHDHARHN